MKSKVVTLKDIGPVHFEESSRARQMNISIRPTRGVRVAVPKGVPFYKAKSFVLGNKEWIKKGLMKLESFKSRVEAVANEGSELTKEEAKIKIKRRLAELSAIHNLPYNRVTIRNQKSRWGSCSSQKNISLNIKIAHLPPELADYVILHELTHTKEPNHSKRFWTRLERHLKGASALDRALKNFHPLYLKEFD